MLAWAGVLLAADLAAEDSPHAAESDDPPALFHLRSIEITGDEQRLLPRDRLLRQTIRVMRANGHYTAARRPDQDPDEDPDQGRSVPLRELGELGAPAADQPSMPVDDALVRAAANAVFEAYTRAGYAAVRVTIPERSIARLTEPDGDGVLVIDINVGRVAEVRVKRRAETYLEPIEQDAGWYARAAAHAPVGPGDAVQIAKIDRHVRWLNRHPGRQVDPVLTPEPDGELTLDYMVSETRPWTLYAQTSNTGTEATHDWRQRFGLIHNNLTRNDDILSLEYTTARFDAVHAGRVSYEFPLRSLPGLTDVAAVRRTAVRGYGSWSRFTASDVGIADLELRGENTQAGGELIQNVYQRGRFFLDLVGGARFERAETDNRTLDVRGRTNFLLPYASLRAERRTRRSQTRAALGVEGNLADVAGTDREQAQRLGRNDPDEAWVAITSSVDQSFFLEPLLQRDWGEPETGSTRGHEVALSLRGQYVPADRRLPPGQTETMGGFRSVRGYPQNFTAADNAIVGTAEYRLHVPRLLPPGEPHEVFGRPVRWRPERELGPTDWNLLLRAFLDAGRSAHNDRRVGERHVTAVGAGLGAEVQLRHHLTLRADWAFALRDADRGTEPVDAGDSELHMVFTLAY